MSAMVSQITGISIDCSTVCSADQRRHQSSASLAFVRGIHRWLASNVANVSIWWRHRMNSMSYIQKTGCCLRLHTKLIRFTWSVLAVQLIRFLKAFMSTKIEFRPDNAEKWLTLIQHKKITQINATPSVATPYFCANHTRTSLVIWILKLLLHYYIFH